MKNWQLDSLDLRPHAPKILSSGPDARAIALEIPAGETLSEHQVHERAWVTVVAGEAEITTAGGQTVSGGPGLAIEFDPAERHAVRAISTVRLLLILTPWPGDGHPGTMPLDEKATVRDRAAEHNTA